MLHRTGLALSFVLLSASAAAEERYLELATGDFTIVSAVSEKQTREIALQVGTFRAVIVQSFGLTLPPAIPSRIYALNRKEWERYAPRAGVAGYFLAQPFSSDLLFDADDKAGGAYELVYHEYMHYILRSFGAGEVPAFLDEGLAEVFSMARFENGVVQIEPRLDYVRYLRTHEWLPFERLLEIKRHDPEYVDHELATAFYAQSWATVYYGIGMDPAFGGRVAAYIRQLNAGDSRVRAAERLIGAASAEANRAIATYIRKRRHLPVARLPLIAPVSDAMRLRALSPDEVRLALGELLLRFGGRHAEARRLFDEVLQRHPDEARALVGAGWASLQAREWDRAAALFDSADHSTLDRATRVALGRGLFQLAAPAIDGSQKPEGVQRAQLVAARALFRSALDEETTRLEAVNGYVLASLALDERDDSLIELAESAYRIAPRSSELAVGLAILHELAGRRSVARGYWQEAARNTQTGPMRARILNALEATAEKPLSPAQ